jgi:predicted nucleic acid-binding protein
VPILVDTGVLIAAIDSSDVDHADAATVLELYAGQLLVASTVVAETSWQLENNIGVAAEAGFLDAIITGELKVIDLLADDYVRAVALIRQYADLGSAWLTHLSLRSRSGWASRRLPPWIGATLQSFGPPT